MIPEELLKPSYRGGVGPKIREPVERLAKRGNITWDEWESMWLNTYERALLIPALTDDALIKHCERMLVHCDKTPSTYDGAVCGTIVPELLNRLRGKNVS